MAAQLSRGYMWIAVMLLLVSSSTLAQDSPSIFGKVYQVDRSTPIGGATIQAIIMSGGGTDRSVLSAADGSYALYLSPGDYRLQVTAPGYAREFYDNVTVSNVATTVTIETTSHRQIDFDLTEGGAISGHIYSGVNGSPMANADIGIRPSMYFFDDGFHTRSDADGSYVVTGLSLGQYKVEVSAPGYATCRYYSNVYGWHNAVNVTVTPPQTTSGIDVRLEPGGSISGHIYASDGVTPVQTEVIADPTITALRVLARLLYPMAATELTDFLQTLTRCG